MQRGARQSLGMEWGEGLEGAFVSHLRYIGTFSKHLGSS